MSYPDHLRKLLASEIERWIARALPLLIRRSLRRSLHGVWGRGSWSELPRTGVLLAANHHSWWDGYLLFLIASRLGRRATVIMGAEQLERFPFFRSHGAVAHTEVRTALRRLEGGGLLFVFPEGEMRPAAGVARLRPGVAWLASRSGAPVIPLALRVQLRGAQHPEAYLWLGEPLAPGPGLIPRLQTGLGDLLAELDTLLLRTDPERPPSDFDRWLSGARSGDRRAAAAAGWWRR